MFLHPPFLFYYFPAAIFFASSGLSVVMNSTLLSTHHFKFSGLFTVHTLTVKPCLCASCIHSGRFFNTLKL